MNYIIFLCFLYLLYISFKRNRSIFTPSNFFILVWFSNYFILMFFVHDFYLYYPGSAFILLMATLVYIGGYIGMEIKVNEGEKKDNIDLKQIIKKLKIVSLIIAGASFCVVPMMMAHIKGDFLSLFNIKYIRHISEYVSYLRYKKEFQFPLSIQIFLGLNYFASLLNGVYFGYLYLSKKFKFVYIYLIPIFTSILIAFITTEKAVIIYTILLFVSSFFVSYNALSHQEFKLSIKKGLLFISLFFILMFLFAYIQMNRYGLNDISGFRHVIKVLKVYVFGHISAFTIWFNEYMSKYTPLGFGRFTFAGLFAFFNIYEREPGIFTDFKLVSSNILFSNVYTAYRGLITDFTMVGCGLLIFLFSFLAGLSYKRYKYSKYAFIYLILFYSITVMSLFVSLLNYNTLIAAFVLLLITFKYYQTVLKL